jgi:hypothetical protein
MKKLLFVFLTFVLSSCVSSPTTSTDIYSTYLNWMGSNKALAVGVQFDTNGNIFRTGAMGWDTGTSITLAKSKAIQQCNLYKQPKTQCILEYVGQSNVYSESVLGLKNEFQKKQRVEMLQVINRFKELCQNYGFTSDNAIAICIQKEINDEKNRLQQQSYAQQQNYRVPQEKAQPNYDALSNYGRCLGTQGETFSSCSNAWQGYTPPKKTVTKCRYDAFGNTITGTCTTQ